MKNSIAGYLIIGIGISLSGWFVGKGFVDSRTTDRFVTVKGISEREVVPDRAIWLIKFVSTHDNLKMAQAGISKSQEIIMKFLTGHGVQTSSISMGNLGVTDVLANAYQRGGPIQSRYIINLTIMVNSGNPELIRTTGQDIGQLVEAGIVLSSGYGQESSPTYVFTRLSEIKPEMIAEATANARRAAEQFARDSGSEIGGIRRANQGVFVILPRENVPGVMESKQFNKIVRVVSTIDYYLEG